MVSSHKFPGVMLDQELRWGPQANYAVAKATKWTLAYQRLACPSMGIQPRLMWQLCIQCCGGAEDGLCC